MQIHIGNLIRDELRRQGHTNEWLAESIGVTTNSPIDASVMVDHVAKWAKVSPSHTVTPFQLLTNQQ